MFAWINNILQRKKRTPGPRFARLGVEKLEARDLLATMTFLGVSNDFLDPANYSDWADSSVIRALTPEDDVVLFPTNQISSLTLSAGLFASVRSITICDPSFTLTVDGDLEATHLYFFAGRIDGFGAVNVLETFDWAGGIMGGSGATTLLSANGNIWHATCLLEDTRTLTNDGNLTWHAGFAVPATTNVINHGSLAIANCSLNSSTPLTNSGTLIVRGFVDFTGPMTLGGVTRIDNSWWNQGEIIINGEVEFSDLELVGPLTGPGTVITSNRFKLEAGGLIGPVSVIVPVGATFDLEYGMLLGGTLTVLGTRTVRSGPLFDIQGGGGGAWEFTTSNNGVRPAPAIPAAGFNPSAAAGSLWRAMLGGAIGGGTDEDNIYRVMESIRTAADLANLNADYTRQSGGRVLLDDLRAELSSDELLRAEALYFRDWDRYVAVSMHEAMYNPARFLINDVELMCRLLNDLRTTCPVVESNYAAEYGGANLRSNVAFKLAFQSGRVLALLDGNGALSDAHNLFILLRGMDPLQLRTADALSTMIRNRICVNVSLIRAQYATLAPDADLDADIANYFNGEPDPFGHAADNLAIANALLAGNGSSERVEIAVRQLHRAMDGPGTDEALVWSTLTGLYADERARVTQLYFAYYNKSLAGEIHAEFSNNTVFGDELDKTVQLLMHGGLSLAQQIFHAVRGWGTDDAALQDALSQIRNMTPTQLDELRTSYLAATGESLDAAILGDLGGRDHFRATQDPQGRPTGIANEALRLLQEHEWEMSGWTSYASTYYQDLFGDSVSNEDLAYATLQARRSAYVTDPTPANEALLRQAIDDCRQTLTSFQEARNATADLMANTVATAAGIAVVVASGGTATPLVAMPTANC